jgi:homopolymeric O-antigen transport system ATP-binding protein
MKPIIRIQGLGKRYRIGERRPYGNLRESITNTLTGSLNALRSLGRNGNGPAPAEDAHVWALRDLSLDVVPGEVLGVIGRNGAGKSTLLKILSRITEPTTGRVDLYGRVGSLLEVGTGFHPELTGRENVFLNAVILGMRRSEIERKFDDIVAFAEVEQFIDTPVKHYSSGMYVRLAFSVAAHLLPDILVVDEVLAVGDARFWTKSVRRMRELSQRGMTILLVTHNMWLVQTVCSKAICLDNGRIVDHGEPRTVIGHYQQTSDNTTATPASARLADDQIKLVAAQIFPESRWASKDEALPDSGLRIQMVVDAPSGETLRLFIRLTSPDALPFFSVYSDAIHVPSTGTVDVEAIIPKLMLMPGEYRVWTGVCPEHGDDEVIDQTSFPLKITTKGDRPPSFNLMWNEAKWCLRSTKQQSEFCTDHAP